MKMLRILGASFRDAFKSVFRNFNLSIASVTCTTITLILVAIAVILSANVNSFTKDLESDLTIVVFVSRDATDEQVTALGESIKTLDNIDLNEFTFLSKEQVKESMQKENETFDSIMSKWTEETNPLQNEFLVKVKDINYIKDTAKEIKEMPFVDTAKYGEEMVDKLVNVFDVVEKVSIVIVVALILVTTFLISNTIKLTIISRKNEIEIMRLIGTSNAVIRLPFVFEGFFLGIIGSIIPVILTVYGYIIAYDKLGGFLFSKIIRMIKPTPFVLYISLILFAIGAIVGMIGSWRAVRKFLKI